MTAAETNQAAPKLFTAESATATLVLVSRIVCDVVDEHDAVVRLRRAMERIELGLDTGFIEELKDDYARCMLRLRQLVAELDVVGVVLEDFEAGTVTFPTVTGDGERVLVWSLAQPDSLHLVKPDEIHKVYKRRAKRRGVTR